MPEFQEDPTNASAYHAMHAKTSEVGSRAFLSFPPSVKTHFQLDKLHKFLPSASRNEEFPDFVYRPTDNPNFVLVVLEYVCIGWFTFEYMIRLVSHIIQNVSDVERPR